MSIPGTLVVVRGVLCRCLCRNPAIPARVGLCRKVSLGNRREAADNDQSRMNTARSYHSRSLGLASCFWRQRTVTAEAAGSSPVDPAIKFNGLQDAPSGRFVLRHKPRHKSEFMRDTPSPPGRFAGAPGAAQRPAIRLLCERRPSRYACSV